MHTQADGDCPFCGAEGKFSVNIETTKWKCWVCGGGTGVGGGNALTFIRRLHEVASEHPDETFLEECTTNRRLCDISTPDVWGVCLSHTSPRTWLVPGYTDGILTQVYRRLCIDSAWLLLPTPGIWPEGKVHALHAPITGNGYDSDRESIVICEGPWDGMVLYELYDELVEYVGQCNIVAVPGCNVWRDEWTTMCKDKNVYLFYDSDHPPTRAGYNGMVRVARKLETTARSIQYINWGSEGYDPDKPSGWDIRDELSGMPDTPLELPQRKHKLGSVFLKVSNVPVEWLTSGNGSSNGNGRVSSTSGKHSKRLEPLDCSDFTTCEKSWKEALCWQQDMSDALSVMFAVCASTLQAGNQLFVQLVGSPGLAKTTICEGLLVSQHCHQLDHLTGFHSGFKKGKKGGEEVSDADCSLIARINGKTLITPEADVLVSSPHFQRVMSEQRRIFDGKSSATYKNSDSDKVYDGLRTPWIMAGTPAMMNHDQSHLGDRFIRYIMTDPNQDIKRLILRSAVRSERAAMCEQANGTSGSLVDPLTRKAYGFTGGYVNWLRSNIEHKIGMIDVPLEAENYCIDLAEMSADLRARPVEEDKRRGLTQREPYDSKELPTRLARQNIRLATHLAVVLNKPKVDGVILSIARRVALDTACGRSLNIVRWMCSRNPRSKSGRSNQECGGLGVATMAAWSSTTEDKLTDYLLFMRKLDILRIEHTNNNETWMLTDRFYELYRRVMEGI